ncbi:Uma2 family endonuclease [Bacteroides sp. OttesenSCG-928-D19]|nr:Uma2 family endonuclease [Bacteroides sp. OttesenSCG-928-D19]
MDIILDPKKRYTYANYLTWLDDKRRELLDGFVHLMSPAPTLTHAQVSGNVFVSFRSYIKKNKGKCKAFTAPFDVRLPNSKEAADDKIYTVVQPDICIICDESKLDMRGCLGAPDMIVEILSPSTQKYDLNDKFNIYEASGVKEYWVISPKEKAVNVFILQDDGRYDKGSVYELGGKEDVPVQTLQGLTLTLNEIFED